ncbi:MAG: OsmC family protein [Planctomycetes bacterium]|nr:OsmC family protein [Planctomycetota bacterium]
MVTIRSKYEGNLRCNAAHGPSDETLATDAPKDNEGLGASFSPTDLVATALQTCALTTMAIIAKRAGLVIDLTGMDATIEKHMASEPRRISALPMTIRMVAGLDAEARALLEDAALNCPVAKSIHGAIEATIEFVYPD